MDMWLLTCTTFVFLAFLQIPVCSFIVSRYKSRKDTADPLARKEGNERRNKAEIFVSKEDLQQRLNTWYQILFAVSYFLSVIILLVTNI